MGKVYLVMSVMNLSVELIVLHLGRTSRNVNFAKYLSKKVDFCKIVNANIKHA